MRGTHKIELASAMWPTLSKKRLVCRTAPRCAGLGRTIEAAAVEALGAGARPTHLACELRQLLLQAHLAETRCIQCRATKRATERYGYRTTMCCYACAQEHDPLWHAARSKANACTVCHTRAKSTEKHGGRATPCCVMCAEVHDPQWHAARVVVTRCAACNTRARADKRYGERTTMFCVQCAETHDAPWHAARLAATRCSACGKNTRATETYANRTTTCCATCAKERDAAWHAARVAATRCKACGRKARAHEAYGGRSTQCCISCSETHDAAWYQAWREAHAGDGVVALRWAQIKRQATSMAKRMVKAVSTRAKNSAVSERSSGSTSNCFNGSQSRVAQDGDSARWSSY